MTTYGYARCSSLDQNEARQIDAMRELDIIAENIYTDKMSGKDFQRPAYQALLNKVFFLPHRYETKRMKTLRYVFFTLMGKVVTHARRKILKIYSRDALRDADYY